MRFLRRLINDSGPHVRLPAHAIYLHWTFDAPVIEGLEFDITIHSDPGSVVGEYFAPFNGSIAGAQAYGGLQTDVNRPGHGGVGKGAIFSTWWSFDPDDMAVPADGFTERGTHEGRFIGVRRCVEWGVGDWRISFGPVSEGERTGRRPGNWYDCTLTPLQPGSADNGNNGRLDVAGPSTWIGSLCFPPSDRPEGSIDPTFVSFLEVYSGADTYSDIRDWHLDVMAFGDGASPASVRTSYPAFPYAEVPCSDAWYDDDHHRVHVRFGRETDRVHRPGQVFTAAR